jgi:paraquat-inducible protein A
MSITPGPGALAFAGVVMLTMFAAMSFDPRLLWDRLDEMAKDPPTSKDQSP